MKFIIIGLGNFGAALAEKLSHKGHEVIGIDANLNKVEALKTKITHVVAIDCTDLAALNTLPVKEADVVVVAIGEDFGASILITAQLKQLNVKRLVSRALSPLHQNILEAIGVSEILHPEEDSAQRFTEVFELNGLIDVFSIYDKHKVVELDIPKRYVGMRLGETDIRKRFNLNVLTIIKQVQKKNIFGQFQLRQDVSDYVSADTIFADDDIIVVFGKSGDVKKFVDD